MIACVGPDLDSTTAQACLKELKEQCLYLHFDGARYCFKKDPNVTLLVEQEADLVARDADKVDKKIKEILEDRLAGHRNAIVWPTKPADIPDRDTSFLVAYLPFDFGEKSSRQVEAAEYFERAGSKQREFRNGLGLAVPAEDQIEGLRRAVRYLLAIEQVRGKAKQINLTDAQKEQLKERDSTEKAAAESALLRLYAEVWFPHADGGTVGIEKVAVGGRPLQVTLSEKKKAMIHERVMELVTVVQKKVFDRVAPGKLATLFNLGSGDAPKPGIRTADVVSGFFSFLGFPRLANEGVVRGAIQKGIADGHFGYIMGSPQLGPDGRYLADHARVTVGRTVLLDEIDLDSGFLIAPSAFPQKPEVHIGGTTPPPTTDGTAPQPPVTGTGSGGGTPPQPGVTTGTGTGGGPTGGGGATTGVKDLDIEFVADRNALYSAWNAIANLADLAGHVHVTVKVNAPKPMDKGKLENGVLEPLRELGLIEE